MLKYHQLKKQNIVLNKSAFSIFVCTHQKSELWYCLIYCFGLSCSLLDFFTTKFSSKTCWGVNLQILQLMSLYKRNAYYICKKCVSLKIRFKYSPFYLFHSHKFQSKEIIDVKLTRLPSNFGLLFIGIDLLVFALLWRSRVAVGVLPYRLRSQVLTPEHLQV